MPDEIEAAGVLGRPCDEDCFAAGCGNRTSSRLHNVRRRIVVITHGGRSAASRERHVDMMPILWWSQTRLKNYRLSAIG